MTERESTRSSAVVCWKDCGKGWEKCPGEKEGEILRRVEYRICKAKARPSNFAIKELLSLPGALDRARLRIGSLLLLVCATQDDKHTGHSKRVQIYHIKSARPLVVLRNQFNRKPDRNPFHSKEDPYRPSTTGGILAWQSKQ